MYFLLIILVMAFVPLFLQLDLKQDRKEELLAQRYKYWKKNNYGRKNIKTGRRRKIKKQAIYSLRGVRLR